MIDQFSRINRTFILHYQTTVVGDAIQPPYLDLIFGLDYRDYSPNLFAYSAKGGDDWHRLAHRFFKNGSLWWVIADLSDVIDPFSELVPGARLLLPNATALLFDIVNFELEEAYI